MASTLTKTLTLVLLAATDILAQNAAPAGTAVIAGRTIDAATGAPVANTLLGLSQRAESGPNTTPVAPNTALVLVMADSQGRFVVRDVPKGSFLLLATAPGYIVSNYGQGRPAGPTRTIDVADGERITDLTIRLFRHAKITGTVTDEAGDPVVGVTVRVMRRAPNGPGGASRYMPGSETTTNDRGEYRLTALTPGQFLVTVPQTQVTVPTSVVDDFVQSAAGRGGSSAGGRVLDLMNSSSSVPSAGGGVRIDDLLLQSSGGGRLVTIPPVAREGLLVYPTSFYLGGLSVPPTLTVGSGEERAGINIRLSPERAVRVSGSVTADGRPAPNVSVRLLRLGAQTLRNENGFEAAATVTSGDGTFTLLGVTPGQYLLKMLRTPRVALPPALASNPAIVAAYGGNPQAPETAAPQIGAQLPLTIGDADIRDLVVPLKAGASIAGQIAFSGTTPPTAQQLQAIGVLLTSEDGGLPGSGLRIVRASATGTFKITAPAPGRYMVTAVGIPVRWRTSGVLVAGQPPSGPIDLSGDDVSDVSLTFTDKLGQVSGTVRTAAGAPSASAEIVVFSTDRRAWLDDPLNPRQPRVEQASNVGVFSMTGLQPGEYFIAAVEDADVPELPDPTFFEAVSRFAKRITLAADGIGKQDLIVGRVK